MRIVFRDDNDESSGFVIFEVTKYIWDDVIVVCDGYLSFNVVVLVCSEVIDVGSGRAICRIEICVMEQFGHIDLYGSLCDIKYDKYEDSVLAHNMIKIRMGILFKIVELNKVRRNEMGKLDCKYVK